MGCRKTSSHWMCRSERRSGGWCNGGDVGNKGMIVKWIWNLIWIGAKVVIRKM